jgi:hypothetical protein
MHRILVPNARKVDHCELNGLNNSRSNLRAATQRQQMANADRGRSGKELNPRKNIKGLLR